MQQWIEEPHPLLSGHVRYVNSKTKACMGYAHQGNTALRMVECNDLNAAWVKYEN